MKKIIQILHLEDNRSDAELIAERINESGLFCNITLAQTKEEFERLLGNIEIDIILADYKLLMYDGMTALHLSNKRLPEVPFIFVSGTLGEETAIEALTLGATDYILKQNLSRLVPAIQRALKESRELQKRKQVESYNLKLSQAIDQSHVSVMITDTEGRIEFVNRNFTNVTGYTTDDIIGHKPGFLKSGETSDEEYKRLWGIISAGGTWEGEFKNRKKNGEFFWEHVTISPVKNTDNEITNYLAVKEDITEHKKLEEQFRQSQKMEAIGRLAGGVAHDFNNMLGVIIGQVELLLIDSNIPEHVHAGLQDILKASRKSSELTKQLLAFARKQKIIPKILDLNEVVESMYSMLRRLVGENIELEWSAGKQLWPVMMDPGQVDQMLANLCVNAKDAVSETGKVSIKTENISFDSSYYNDHPEFRSGDFVRLEISDNGSGMDQETIKNIFEPFYTTKDNDKGTGLGLATVYGIVRQNHGFIKVDSDPGLGTSFNIYIPRNISGSDFHDDKERNYQVIGGNETILVVEDNIEILNVCEKLLKQQGYSVLTSESPGQALRIIDENAEVLDLIITDVIMPEMNGPELADIIRAKYPSLKILFMSGYTADIMMHKNGDADNINFLKKPFSIQELDISVRRALNM